MRKKTIIYLVLIGGGLLFVNLFHQESMGLNTVFFSIPLLVITLLKNAREAPYSLEISGLATATFLAALAVVGNDSFLAKTMYWSALLLFLGFIKHQYLRFIPLAFSAALSNMVLLPWTIFQSWASPKKLNINFNNVLKQFLQLLLPVGLFLLFLGIYYLANAKFGGMVDQVLFQVGKITHLDINPSKVALFLVGFFLLAVGTLTAPLKSFFSAIQSKFALNLYRKRGQKRQGIFAVIFPTLILKNRFKASIITLTMLNALLFIVNLTDLRYVWFSRRALSANELSEYVHEGTSLLILAVLLAALVVMLIFRKNLNFFPNNEGLKKLAYAWIGQNLFMVFSVANRNFQYLANFGLTHKRIGVFIFLLIVVVGLVTLYIKIRDQKSTYFLWHRNTWSVFLILLVASFVNWNLFITRINIHAGFIKNLDVNYLFFDLSEQNAFLLEKNKTFLFSQPNHNAQYLQKRLDRKINQAKKARNIRSWNWPYYLNKKAL